MSALGDIRVLDMSEGVAPAVVGMFLADFGADVIKVERPGGDPTRTDPGFAVWNRGKRSVVVDPSSGPDVEWLAASIAGADVCIVGAGQDLVDWGAAVAVAAADNARIVLAQLPAYLADTTPWTGGKESNSLLSAHVGVSFRQASEDGNPVEPVYAHLLYVQGLWATVCAVAALVERERSGFGQTVTVTGVNGVMEAAVGSLTVNPNAPDPVTAVGGVGRHPTYRPVEAKDGWLASGALGPKFETALLEILGIDHILDDPRLAGDSRKMILPQNMTWAMDQVSAAFRAETVQHWVDALRARGIPAAPVRERTGLLNDPQVLANDLRVEVEDPERGTVVMPGVPFVLTATPGQVRGPAPLLGAACGVAAWPPQPQPRPLPTGHPPLSPGPLSGYQVLNLGPFVATPYAGFLLSELGADVIKVEAPDGDAFRASAFAVNRGMRSLSIDLRSARGCALFREVAASADIVIDGMRPGVMAKLGIDHCQLEAINPEIITLSLAAFGMHGSLASAGGVDMVVQAMTGMLLAQGEPDKPVANSIAIIDVTTAAMSALASVMALYHRERTGQGQRAWDSLLGTATYLGLGELVEFEGRPPPIQGSADFKGLEPLDRYYRVSDGWIRVQALDPGAVTVEALGRGGLRVGSLSTEGLASALETVSGAGAVAAFAAAGVPAVQARRISQLYHDEELRSNEFFHLRRADDGTIIASPGRYATFSRTQRLGPLTPPGVGEHSAAVLAEAGVDSAEITRAVGAGVVSVGGRPPLLLAPIYR